MKSVIFREQDPEYKLRFTKKIGEGNWGYVYKAYKNDDQNQVYAVK